MPIVCRTHQKNVILACLHPNCHQPRPICSRCVQLHSNHSANVLDLSDVNEKLEEKINNINQVEQELKQLLKAAENAHGISLVNVLATLSGELSQQRELQKLYLNNMSWDELNGALEQIAKIKLQPQAMPDKQQPLKKSLSLLIYIGIVIGICLFYFSQHVWQQDKSSQLIELQNENQQLKLQDIRGSKQVKTMKQVVIWSKPRAKYVLTFNDTYPVCSIEFQVQQIPIYLEGIYQGQLYKGFGFDYTNMNLKMHLQIQKSTLQKNDRMQNNTVTVYEEDILIEHNKMLQYDDIYFVVLNNRVALEQNTHYKLSIQLKDFAGKEVKFNFYHNQAPKSPYVIFNDQNNCGQVQSLIISEQ